MIPFNRPPYVGTELSYVRNAVEVNRKISGDGPYTKLCSQWLESQTGSSKVLLTTSGTTALEMAALLCSLEPGDEVILPSYTFSSTATAFVLAGARLVFVDIRPDTMNIDESCIEAAISSKTKAIAVVHYAGVACEMDAILAIAGKHGLFVIEDAAQAVMSSYKGRVLGSIGDFGCYSFHETKNLSMGEGGALLINDEEYIAQAEVLREKGTNRSRFLRGEIDKYTWESYGSSYLPSDMNAAYLWAQLEASETITADRLKTWDRYHGAFLEAASEGLFEIPTIPDGCEHNAHMYYLKCADLEQRTACINHLKVHGVHSTFHYVPLHSSIAGRKYGRFHGDDSCTTRESERLLRLPLYYGLSENDCDQVIQSLLAFFGKG